MKLVFRAYHPDLPPSAFTELVGIEPTSVQLAGGSPFNPPTNLSNGWFFESTQLTDSRDAGTHLRELVNRFHDRLTGVRAGQETGWRCDILGAVSRRPVEAFALSADTAARIGELRVSVTVLMAD